ncbi:EamA family transporter RarD [Mesorhizobium sp. M2A.F.Ca.ET.037.01.1.1]|uniref:EamA family transporter RarD n=1 Tax=unclassified Mesorhizobium TaxID=325217 RepID=UPI000F7616FC|nr:MULTISPECIES: EamA family transporter RarD [unclassified Mesorhizobium]RUY10348.1 EamA family transporter RarD [Mesorhizobium sp. M2A.F.Ca.ET.040.01.1.1]RVC69870.1 EamA family transporter RarD [Mesorhizobium sp. M00.F.Ca.ET.038.03.1.1]RVC75237.1 EamA family transporter RarD [Mesorhizobium sp. M2A.F.Ca.ET.046.02.1.1]AZO33359.1 EamA family transporter RarD [Mesorhizobium sp. M2A.F.Ca.ET.046.03.2.1]RUX14740.1 EamA family transporter RarD [Mesorhizobium sp. M2A.F.Ca.ET.037.01.1.1]
MVTAKADPDQVAKGRRGFLLALGAYFLWGLLPFYMKAVAHLPLAEVIANRVVWSVPIAAAVLLWAGRTADFKAAIRSPKSLAMAALTAVLISVNWGIYVWAIAVDRTVETALGYYINPLVNVIVGAVLLGEKLDRLQISAVVLAAIAVTVLTVEAGKLPWVSLALAFSFAAYGFFRKTLPIGPSQGFLLEVLLLSVPALCYIVYLIATGQDHLISSTGADTALLIGCGPITAVPLLLFAFGARLLRLSTIGIMQYIAPTMVFLIAVLIFGEPFGTTQAIAFGLIWTALAMYSWSMFRGREARPAAPATR